MDEKKKTYRFSIDDVIAETRAAKSKADADQKEEAGGNTAPAIPEIERPSVPEFAPEIEKTPAPQQPEIPEKPRIIAGEEKPAEVGEKAPEAPEKEEAPQAPSVPETGSRDIFSESPAAPRAPEGEEAPKEPEPPKPEPLHTASREELLWNGENGYYNRAMPAHFLNINLISEALRAESSVYGEDEEEAEETVESSFEAAQRMTEIPMKEYESKEDAEAVSSDIREKMQEYTMRFLGTGICFVLILLFGFLGECEKIGKWKFPLHMSMTPYLAVTLILLLGIGILNYRGMIGGFKGLFTLRADHDSSAALALAAAFIQTAAAFLFPERIVSGDLHLYASLAALAFFANASGRLLMVRRISKNFKALTAPDMRYAAEVLDDNAKALRLAGEYIERAPLAGYQHKNRFPAGFMRYSTKSDPSRFVSQMIAPIGFLASLVLFAASFIMFRDFADAITAFAVSACICVPVANLICVNLPVTQLSTLARKWGGMAVGYSAVEKFSQTNMVLFDADDLFPKGTVEIKNVKTFGRPHVDEAILSASALVKELGGPLSGAFEAVIKNKIHELPNVSQAEYEEGLGMSGWCRGNQVLVGNRKMMMNYAVELPPKDIETQFLQKGLQILYVAMGGAVCAMIVLQYRADTRRASELAQLEKNGITAVIRTNDVNITAGLIASCFGVDGRMVRILPEKCMDIYKETVETETERAQAILLTKGRSSSLFRLLTACIRQRSNIIIAIILQVIAVILGFVFIAFIVCYSGFAQLTTAALLLYELFWLVVIMGLPQIRRP